MMTTSIDGKRLVDYHHKFEGLDNLVPTVLRGNEVSSVVVFIEKCERC